MDRVFSVEGISDRYWSPSPHPPPTLPSAKLDDSTTMNRSESEWAFQRLLHEVSAEAAVATTSTSDSSPQSSWTGNDVVEIEERNRCVTSHGMSGGGSAAFSVAASAGGGGGGGAAAPNIPVDSEEYQAFLKSKLSLACAAVALSRASFLKPQDSLSGADSGSQASNTSQLQSHAPSKGAEHDLSRLQDKDVNVSLGISSLPAAQKMPGGSVKPATSWSSRDQSEDDENEGEIETTENMDPADAKRVRRMLSNRESARRSRRRKQAHLTELETQVAELRVENSTLLKRLGGISQKYSEAAVNNRVLKADVETLRAKVKMAEDTVKRITGLNPIFHAMPGISTMSMPSFDGSPSETSSDAAVPVQDDPKRHFYHTPNSPISTNDQRANNSLAEISSAENVQPDSGTAGLAGSKMGRTALIQRVTSLEHLQKRIHRGASSPGTQE